MALRAISLYSGIGGLDFGFEAAGFEMAVAVEMDAVACATMRLNQQSRPASRRSQILEGMINDFSSRTLLQRAGLRKRQADVLIGGPPCQPFSKSSYWVNGDTERLDDPRADTLTSFLRVLRDTCPRAFLLENVKGFAFQGKEEGLSYVLEGVRRINEQEKTRYRVHYAVLNAADYGVPQLRERVFLVASRDGRDFEFPAPTHGPECKEPHRTAWDALGDLEQHPSDLDLTARGKWAQLLPSVPEGENYLWHTPRGGGHPLFGWRTRYWSFLLKLAKAKPSWTIQASPGPAIGPFHWTSRLLSPRELCRLQTFPDEIQIDSKRSDAQRMVGNAVPSLLAEVLALEIRRQLLDSLSRRRSPKLLPPRRFDTPPAEQVAPLHAKYHH
ncbi:unnamed protein product, partial [marine sediment metagenome]